jgi:hypothetical protein
MLNRFSDYLRVHMLMKMLGLVRQAGFQRFYGVIFQSKPMKHAETLHMSFGGLVLDGSIPCDTLKYPLGRQGSKTPQVPSVFSPFNFSYKRRDHPRAGLTCLSQSGVG